MWARRVGAPKGGRAKNVALFFLSRPHLRSLFLSLGVFSCLFCSLWGCLLLEFWWCFRRPGPSNVRVFALGLSCESPRRRALSGPVVKNHILSKTAGKYNSTSRSTCLALFQACQPKLAARLRVHPQYRYRRIPRKPNTKITMRTSIEHGEPRCVICGNVSGNSLKI